MRLVFATGALVAALVVGVVPVAHAGSISPFATLTVGGQAVNITLTPDPQNSGVQSFEGLLTTDLFDVQVNGTLDANALILFSLSVENFGTTPLDLSLALGTPIGTLAFVNGAQSGISGTLTDATGDGFSLQPTLGDLDTDGLAELLVPFVGDPTNLGIDVGLATMTTGAYGPFTASAFLPGSPLFTSLQVNLGFQLSGNGDFAALQGATQIESAVAEPATLWLMSTGALALIGRRRRRRVARTR